MYRRNSFNMSSSKWKFAMSPNACQCMHSKPPCHWHVQPRLAHSCTSGSSSIVGEQEAPAWTPLKLNLSQEHPAAGFCLTPAEAHQGKALPCCATMAAAGCPLGPLATEASAALPLAPPATRHTSTWPAEQVPWQQHSPSMAAQKTDGLTSAVHHPASYASWGAHTM